MDINYTCSQYGMLSLFGNCFTLTSIIILFIFTAVFIALVSYFILRLLPDKQSGQFEIVPISHPLFGVNLPESIHYSTLEQVLHDYSQDKRYWLNKNAINSSSVAKIHELKNMARSSDSHKKWVFGHSDVITSELHNLIADVFKVCEIKKITVDIANVDGLAASKSSLEEYASMTQFVEDACLPYFELTAESLSKNLAHKEIRILHQEHSSDYFQMYGWCEKLFLMNSGGSHHFASAQYIARALEQQIPVTGRIVLNYIDKKGLINFTNVFQSILLPLGDFVHLELFLERSGLEVYVFMAPFMPEGTVILFYKKGSISEELDALFKNRFTDFNSELTKFYAVQRENLIFQHYMGSYEEAH